MINNLLAKYHVWLKNKYKTYSKLSKKKKGLKVKEVCERVSKVLELEKRIEIQNKNWKAQRIINDRLIKNYENFLKEQGYFLIYQSVGSSYGNKNKDAKTGYGWKDEGTIRVANHWNQLESDVNKLVDKNFNIVGKKNMELTKMGMYVGNNSYKIINNYQI